MKKYIKYFVLALVVSLFTNQVSAQTSKYKCMLQMALFSGKPEAWSVDKLVTLD